MVVNPVRFDPFYEVTTTTHALSITTPVELVEADPSRQAIVLATPFSLALSGPVSFSNAFRLGVSSPVFSLADAGDREILNYENHGRLVTMPWFGRIAAGAATITVTTITFRPKGGVPSVLPSNLEANLLRLSQSVSDLLSFLESRERTPA